MFLANIMKIKAVESHQRKLIIYTINRLSFDNNFKPEMNRFMKVYLPQLHHFLNAMEWSPNLISKHNQLFSLCFDRVSLLLPRRHNEPFAHKLLLIFNVVSKLRQGESFLQFPLTNMSHNKKVVESLYNQLSYDHVQDRIAVTHN